MFGFPQVHLGIPKRHACQPAATCRLAFATRLLVLGVAAVAANAQTPAFEPYASQGDGDVLLANQAIRPFLTTGIPSPVPTQAISIDTLGNGRPDVFACHLSLVPYPKGKFPCRMFRPAPDGSITEVTAQVFGPGPLPSLEHPRHILTADFNGDGRPDIFVAAHGYDAPPFAGEVGLLLLSNGDGTYSDRSSTLPQLPAFSHGACLGDIDGDGRPDIFLSNYPTTSEPSYFLMGKGDGTFTRRTAGIPAAILDFTDAYASCAMADMDGDGHVDLLLGASNGTDYGHIYYNDGNANFTTRSRTTLPPGPFAGNRLVLNLVPLDINRDGLMDVLVVSSLARPDRGMAVQALVNLGGGSFRDETATRMPADMVRSDAPTCYALRVADFNLDGWPDLYCDNQMNPPTFPRFFVNRGDGTWSAIPDGTMPQAMGAYMVKVDFDGDGRPDLLRIVNNGVGDIQYKSFRNVTPRSTAPAPNYTALWWVPAESGWGLNVNHQGDIVFATLFTYDSAGRALWLYLPAGTKQADGVTYAGRLYRATGPAFNASPFTPITTANLTDVGTMSIAFSGGNAGTLSYTVNGTAVTKSVQRYVFGSRAADCVPATGSRASLANYQDLWWNAAESGWGLNVTHQDTTMFATLFTYGSDGRDLWLFMPAGQRQSDGSYTGDLNTATGPAFNAQPFTPIASANVTKVGTMSLRFPSGTSGTLTYTVNGAAVTKQIQRYEFSSPVPSCS